MRPCLHDVDGRIGDGARPQVLQQVARLQAGTPNKIS